MRGQQFSWAVLNSLRVTGTHQFRKTLLPEVRTAPKFWCMILQTGVDDASNDLTSSKQISFLRTGVIQEHSGRNFWGVTAICGNEQKLDDQGLLAWAVIHTRSSFAVDIFFAIGVTGTVIVAIWSGGCRSASGLHLQTTAAKALLPKGPSILIQRAAISGGPILLTLMRPERVELPTYGFVVRRSIQLSYGRATSKCSTKFLGEFGGKPVEESDESDSSTHNHEQPLVEPQFRHL